MKKVFLCVAALCSVVVCVAMLAYFHPASIGSSDQESSHLLDTLETLGDSALAVRDVPVGALLLAGQDIIGTGYNTVRRDGNAGGHAEIVAISGAIGRLGIDGFKRLNRDSLVLVTTFEPCAMCRGAIVEYNIRRVRILKPKPLLSLLREDFRMFRYYWTRTVSGPASLQDTMFRRHPDYHGNE